MLLGHEPFFATFRAFLEQVSSRGIVLDLGTPEAFRKELSGLRTTLRSAEYFTMDYAVPGQRVASDVGGDIQRLPFGDGVADGIICKEVLEHVPDPFRAVGEMYRVLKPGGILLVTVPFLEPYHASPGIYEDYWRFTAAGVGRLLGNFASVEVKMYGGVLYMLAVAYLPRAVRRAIFSRPVNALFWALDRRWQRTSTIMHMALARK